MRRALALTAAAGLVLAAPRARAQTADAQPAGVYDAAPAGLVHEAVTLGRRGNPITITVGVQNELSFSKLVLAYRPEGAADFRGREMTLVTEGTYRAEIPAQGTQGATVAYFIEAEDKDGTPVAGRASAQSPLVIELAGSVPAAASSDDDDDADVPAHRWFVAALVGGGAGWARGDGDTNADTIEPSRVALAGLGHLAPEIGYWLSATFMVSAQGRFELVTGTTDVYANGRVYHGANYAAAGFLKGTWILGGGPTAHQTTRPFFSLAAGVGQIRHVVTFAGLDTCGASGKSACVDTIAAGPVAVGPGAGVMFDLAANVAGVVQLNTQLTFPNYSFNVDANLGVALTF
jgi:hypothetical protein